ncbi:MAG: cytochrome C oxidase subunit IV family protein [Deltaproteobacteria bacterium]|nr:cytochrome C oxidase subunit IV family protein [Deltaproteobacteria bacterium]
MADHGTQYYVKIWGILLVLLVISIFGPFLEIPAVTLITAFGIAFVKAYLVVKNFMHMNVQPAYVGYMLSTCLVFMLLLFAGSAPDVMKKDGDNWVKTVVVVQGPATMHHGEENSGDEHGGAELH